MLAFRLRSVVFAGTALVAALLAGCTGTGPSATGEAVRIQTVWPEPPNTPRYVFDAMLRSAADIHVETSDERLRRTLTGRGAASTDPVYRKPSALAARGGLIYVADPPTATVVVFDVPRGRVFRIGTRRPNVLRQPVALALDDKGQLYVLDSRYSQVLVFDALGLYLFSVGDPQALTRPAGVAVSPDGQTIYIVDRGSLESDDHKVVAYAPDGSERFRLGPRGPRPGEFNIPIAAATGPDGTLFVLDSGNFRVQVFDPQGAFVREFGSVGNGFGQFSRPRGIAVDVDARVFVSDGTFNNVQLFTAEGELLMWIGTPELRDAPGHFGLVAGLATDETGRLYVVDHYHNKIEVYRRAQGSDGAPQEEG